MELDIDACYRLLGAVVLTAAKDARKGDRGGNEFLEFFGVRLADVKPTARNFWGRRNGSETQDDEPMDPASCGAECAAAAAAAAGSAGRGGDTSATQSQADNESVYSGRRGREEYHMDSQVDQIASLQAQIDALTGSTELGQLRTQSAELQRQIAELAEQRPAHKARLDVAGAAVKDAMAARDQAAAHLRQCQREAGNAKNAYQGLIEQMATLRRQAEDLDATRGYAARRLQAPVVRSLPHTPRACLLYTSPSPRD